jgi:hypothetical protein
MRLSYSACRENWNVGKGVVSVWRFAVFGIAVQVQARRALPQELKHAPPVAYDGWLESSLFNRLVLGPKSLATRVNSSHVLVV